MSEKLYESVNELPSDEDLKPLFPGRTFISTVLDAVDSKDTMTGKMTGKYLQRAVMAGLFVGIFFTAFFYIVGQFASDPANPGLKLAGRVIAALTFGWALVLIYYTNSELLTSNMMVVTVGVYHKRLGWLHSLRILGLCLLGNLLGALIVAIILRFSSIISGPTMDQMLAAASTKTGYVMGGWHGIADLFVRGILCNFCINIAMLMVYNGKLSNDFTKCTIMVVAVFVFAFCGFEHSVADSALFLILGMYGKVNAWQAIATVAVAMLGNFVGGGILIGLNFATMNDERRYSPEALAE
ncbi:formate/nitrite transporter family protein [Bombiscardovia apis]|uniref:Formate/nitrite transporter family protein n=1 Tax=Bombiscardovia apis TaxID=2932182 RepID=A0ABN6SEJ4_9BIFI|nr:formate/nitrite transporter family protein [Bombiscardovia apis]BDR53923.1 formate/nitrite transporter family protein [Bombiscardovia apis]